MMDFLPYINHSKKKIDVEMLEKSFYWFRNIILDKVDNQFQRIRDIEKHTFIIIYNELFRFAIDILKIENIGNDFFINIKIYHKEDRVHPYSTGLNEDNLSDSIDYIKNIEKEIFKKEAPRHLLIITYIYENYKTAFEKTFFSSGYPIADKIRAKGHTYILGGTGSGKSELMKFLLFKDFQHAKRSVIVLEPHGKLTKEVAHLKGKDHEKLVYVSFDDDYTGNDKTAVINPFYLKERTPTAIKARTDAIILAFGMIMKAEFTDNMDILLSSTIPVILGKENGSFWELQRFFDDTQNDDLVQLGQQSTNPALRQIFARYKELETFKGTKNALFLKLQKLLGDEKFANFTTGKTTIDIDEITAQGKWLLFNTRPKDIGEEGIEAIGKFLISLIYSTVKQRNEDDPKNTPTFLYIDEFQNYVTETTKKILSESRKYKFSSR